jgi:hypothetical protein
MQPFFMLLPRLTKNPGNVLVKKFGIDFVKKLANPLPMRTKIELSLILTSCGELSDIFFLLSLN